MIYPPCYAVKEYPFYAATLDTSTAFRRRFTLSGTRVADQTVKCEKKSDISDILDSREIVRAPEKKNLKKAWKIRKNRKNRKNRTVGKLELAENKGLVFHANARLKPRPRQDAAGMTPRLPKMRGKFGRIGKIGKNEPCHSEILRNKLNSGLVRGKRQPCAY